MRDRFCPSCGERLAVRKGAYGAFFGCSAYPICTYTEQANTENDPMGECKNSLQPWVNASGLGEVQFCPQSYFISIHGNHGERVERSQKAKEQMQRGNRHHATVSGVHNSSTSNASTSSQPSSGMYIDKRCYIATYALGEHHPVTIGLRHWRDDVLKQTQFGRLFIKTYYYLSPKIIKWFGKFKLFNQCSRFGVLIIAKIVGVKK